MNIQQAADSLRARRISSVELTTAAIGRLDRHTQLRAFITVTPEAGAGPGTHRGRRTCGPGRPRAAPRYSYRAQRPLRRRRDIRTTRRVPASTKILFLDIDATIVSAPSTPPGAVKPRQTQHARAGLGDHHREPVFGTVGIRGSPVHA